MEAGGHEYGADKEACGEEFRDRESFRIGKECGEEREEFKEHECGGGEDSCFGFRFA